ncbi:MAG: hypothetical protein PHX54_12285, partial [Lentimicrobiaceae bacterium]|nr:hypothetical protein [Lentimicrobiaceae bacterium]
GIDIEISLFAKENNENLIELTDKAYELDVIYKYDSLRYMKLFPSNLFYERSLKNIGEMNFEKYRKMKTNERRKELRQLKKANTENIGSYYMWYDLRQKLKI